MLVAFVLASALMSFPIDSAPPERGFQSFFETVQSYDCRNVSCKRLRSCEEACYKLKVCGQRIRDADNDGIPCENLCKSPCP